MCIYFFAFEKWTPLETCYRKSTKLKPIDSNQVIGFSREKIHYFEIPAIANYNDFI